MKKLLSKAFNRITITALLILVQLGWMLLLFGAVATSTPWINAVLTLASVLIGLFIINKDMNPDYKIGWVILICLLPVFGSLFYIFFGTKQPTQKIRDRLKQTLRDSAPLVRQDPAVLQKLPPRVAATARYIGRYGPYPMWENTAAKYFSLGDEAFPEMLRQLESAQRFIFIEYFIIAEGEMWGRVLEILKRKAAQGVDVRVMYDDLGSMNRVPGRYDRALEAMGIKAIAVNPFVPVVSVVMNNRDHRKILVVDGRVGFSGGINLADEYINKKSRFGHWKDTALMLTGDAVWNYTVMFLQMWNAFRPTDGDLNLFRPVEAESDGPQGDSFAQPYGDSPLDSEPLSENVYIDIISQAEKYVYIFTPYLIIGNELKTALCLAAKRGVDVRIGTPGIPDKKIIYALTRSYYPPLIKAGIRIYEYTPGFLHAKSFVSDDTLAEVGSINMDYRSLYLHFECGCFLYDSPLVASLKKDCLDTYHKSRRVTLDDCRTGFFGGLFNAVLRVFSPLL